LQIIRLKVLAMPQDFPAAPSPLAAELESLKTRHAALEKKFDEYISERQKEETRRLRTALLVAGGVVSALLTFIWAEIIWPVINGTRGR
jgi:hypothetical protein